MTNIDSFSVLVQFDIGFSSLEFACLNADENFLQTPIAAILYTDCYVGRPYILSMGGKLGAIELAEYCTLDWCNTLGLLTLEKQN
jgi:hypothetical protein